MDDENAMEWVVVFQPLELLCYNSLSKWFGWTFGFYEGKFQPIRELDSMERVRVLFNSRQSPMN